MMDRSDNPSHYKQTLYLRATSRYCVKWVVKEYFRNLVIVLVQHILSVCVCIYILVYDYISVLFVCRV